MCSFLLGCAGKSASLGEDKVTAESCKGIYYTTDAQSMLHKWNQFWQADQRTCLTKNMPLSLWENSSQKFLSKQVTCSPQPGFPSRSLVTANNFYSYRDGRELIDFNSTSGIYRKLLLGQNKDGTPAFSRSQGCFYQRPGLGVNSTYGDQLMLDADVGRWASSEAGFTHEIFRYQVSGSNVSMVRNDTVSEWNYSYCNYEQLPDDYCKELDNGNIFFEPALSTALKNQLLAEAILIRTQFNFTTINTSSFEAMWSSIGMTSFESMSGAFLYQIDSWPDLPALVDGSWHDYITGVRTNMPDASSSQTPPICYSGSQTVTLSNGQPGKINGEVCYVLGSYIFSAN